MDIGFPDSFGMSGTGNGREGGLGKGRTAALALVALLAVLVLTELHDLVCATLPALLDLLPRSTIDTVGFTEHLQKMIRNLLQLGHTQPLGITQNPKNLTHIYLRSRSVPDVSIIADWLMYVKYNIAIRLLY